MSDSRPVPGSIWKIRTPGKSQLGLVLSGPREVRPNLLEHKVAPLYDAGDPYVHSSADYVISADQTNNGKQYIVAVDNIRSIPADAFQCASDLVLTRDVVLSEIRERYRDILAGRIVREPSSSETRNTVIKQWQPLTGRLLAAPAVGHEVDSHVNPGQQVCSGEIRLAPLSGDLVWELRVDNLVLFHDAQLGEPPITACGAHIARLHMPVTLDAYCAAGHVMFGAWRYSRSARMEFEQLSELFSLLSADQPQKGDRIAETV